MGRIPHGYACGGGWRCHHDRGYASVTYAFHVLPYENYPRTYVSVSCCRNSVPPTTTLDNLRAKARAARAGAFVDVAFWAGVVPGNQVRFRKFLNKYICARKIHTNM